MAQLEIYIFVFSFFHRRLQTDALTQFCCSIISPAVCLSQQTFSIWKLSVSSLIYRFKNISPLGEPKNTTSFDEIVLGFKIFLYVPGFSLCAHRTWKNNVFVYLFYLLTPVWKIKLWGFEVQMQEVSEQLRCDSFSCNSLKGSTIKIWQQWLTTQFFPIIFIYFLLLFTCTVYFNKCSPSLVTFSKVYYKA